jgi:folate-dependent tRNA-U54 methylase TrmFO/GidA
MCVLRCHAFGVRVSLAGRAGIAEISGKKGEQTGAMSGSCELVRESLAPDVLAEMSRTGMVMRPIPLVEDDGSGKLAIKACQQYTQAEYKTNVVVLDTGGAKLMTPFFPLRLLRQVRGFENVRFCDPYGASIGNSIRYINMAPRNDALKIDGLDNVFCAGEKAGLLVGHTEAVVTGTLAGYNAARHAGGKQPLILPETLLAGDAVRHVREQMQTEKGLGMKFTFSGSVFFERMRQRGSYLTDVAEIRRRVAATGLANVFAGRPGVAAIHRKPVATAAN